MTDTPTDAAPPAAPHRNPLKRLYYWVLSWAQTRYGAPALAGISFAESSVFPVPPDVLLIALVLGNRDRWAYFATVCSVASVVGGLAGYGIGMGLWTAVDQFFFDYVPGFSVEQFEKVTSLYETYNFWIVFVAAFTPLPYKVITISAGVFGVNLPMFMIATVFGRSARFFLVSFLLYLYGEPIHKFIDKYFGILSVVFVILLAGGFYVLKFVLH